MPTNGNHRASEQNGTGEPTQMSGKAHGTDANTTSAGGSSSQVASGQETQDPQIGPPEPGVDHNDDGVPRVYDGVDYHEDVDSYEDVDNIDGIEYFEDFAFPSLMDDYVPPEDPVGAASHDDAEPDDDELDEEGFVIIPPPPERDQSPVVDLIISGGVDVFNIARTTIVEVSKNTLVVVPQGEEARAYKGTTALPPPPSSSSSSKVVVPAPPTPEVSHPRHSRDRRRRNRARRQARRQAEEQQEQQQQQQQQQQAGSHP